jgi:septal ring factor EnvC (AmiA/AmiB activator)
MVTVMPERMHTACVAIAMVLLTGGCASVPPGVPQADQNSGQRRADAELQDAKAETTILRADLAAARIATAKQEAELRELRRQVTELQQVIDANHAEVNALREERDRLAKSVTVAQVHVTDPSALPASAADVAALQAKLREMETVLTTLTAELAQVRKDVDQSTSVSKSKSSAARPSRPRSP